MSQHNYSIGPEMKRFHFVVLLMFSEKDFEFEQIMILFVDLLQHIKKKDPTTQRV